MRIVQFLVCFLALVLTVGCKAADKQAQASGGLRVLSERADRRIVQLPNGLVVIAQRNTAAPVVSVQCYVKTGSIYEQEFNGLGLSHFLEHLVAGGTTETRTEEESNAILGRIGGQTNAGTGLDTVSYYVNTTSNHAETAIDLMSDWIQHAKIRDQEFNREKDVIGREFAMGRGEPGRIVWKLLQQARFPANHPARHPTIGYEEEFVEVTRDQVYDFYKRMYVPNNMTFLVVGDIDPAKVATQVAGLWAESKPGPLPKIVLPMDQPIAVPREVVGHAEIELPQLELAWMGTTFGTQEDYALDLLARVLGDGELCRLAQSVRDEQGLVTEIGAGNYSFHWGQGLFNISGKTGPDNIEQAKAAILAEVQKIIDKGVTQDELERAKRKSVTEAVYATQTAEATADRIANDFLTTGDPDYLHKYAAAIDKVSASQVQAAARKFLNPQGLMTIKLIPRKGASNDEKRPAESPRGQKLAAGPGMQEFDLDNNVLVSKLIASQKKGGKVSTGGASAETLHTLPNGLRVIVQRDSRLPIVAMQWYQLGGLLSDTAGSEGVANASASMLTQGAGNLSADELAQKLEGLGAQLDASAGNSTLVVGGQALSKDWPTVLGLMSDVIQKPTFPEKEWEQMKPRILAEIDSINDVWYSHLRTTLRQAYFGNHPWSQPSVGRREVVEKITVEDLKKFHLDRLSAHDSVLAVCGDVDEAKFLKAVERLFASLPQTAAKPFVAPVAGPQKTGYIHAATGKPTPAVSIGYGPGLERTSPDYQALQVMNGVLSSFPVGWLDQSLRGEGQGLVYAVGAGTFTGVSKGYWSLLFNTQNPTLIPALEKALKVVDRIRTETVDDATLQRARQSVLVEEAFGRQSYGQLASAAALDELYGLGFDYSAKEIAAIQKVTAEDINRVAKKYLRTPTAVILSNETPDVSKLPPLEPK